MFEKGVLYCPKNPEEISIVGNFFAEKFKLLQINVIINKDTDNSENFFKKMNLAIVVNDKIIVYDETTRTTP